MAKNFWGAAAETAPSQEPYRIAVGGHGGFVVRKDFWNKVGGYGPEGIFEGYGGEEMYFDLKIARMGYRNWIDPKLIHYHYHGDRGYRRHYSTEYYRNMLLSAKVIGGDKWMHTVYNSFLKESKPRDVDIFQCLQDADLYGKNHMVWLNENSVRTLDEQLEYFDTHKIAID